MTTRRADHLTDLAEKQSFFWWIRVCFKWDQWAGVTQHASAGKKAWPEAGRRQQSPKLVGADCSSSSYTFSYSLPNPYVFIEKHLI